jgi:predicted RNase H-like nuclease (RuvC/YqgF family)
MGITKTCMNCLYRKKDSSYTACQQCLRHGDKRGWVDKKEPKPKPKARPYRKVRINQLERMEYLCSEILYENSELRRELKEYKRQLSALQSSIDYTNRRTTSLERRNKIYGR